MFSFKSDFRLADKTSHHPVAQRLLGHVVAVEYLQGLLILHYQDGHSAALRTDEDGDFQVGDFEVPMC